MSRDSLPTEDNIVGAPRYPRKEFIQNNDMGQIANGTIGTGADNKVAKTKKFVNKASLNKEKVALYSERNLNWSGNGQLVKGYNIVNKEVAEKWLSQRGVRLATPEEVKKEYDL